MRDLGSGAGSLLAAQQAASAEPYVKIDIGPDGAPDYTYSSLSDEIIKLKHIERPFGGTAAIILNNYDKSLKDIDFRGRRVEISYWFEGIGGTAGKTAPLWVLSDRELSSEGQNEVELICIDIWNVLSLLKMGIGGTRLAGTITGTLALQDTVTGETSGATGTVILLGTAYVHLGDVSGKFVVGEKAKKDGGNYITIDTVGTVGSSSGPAWNWDVRDKTIENILDQLLSSISVDVDIDDSDGIVDSYKPPYSTVMGQTTFLQVVQDMLRKTMLGFRMQNDGDLHLFEIDDTPGDEVYTYDTDHVFYVDIRDLSLILPNRIICVDGEGGHQGSAENATAIAAFMAITSFIGADKLVNNTEADSLAAAELARSEWNSAAGTIVAPMNVGQELFDYIKVIDSRNDITYYGWVGGIVREWESGVYRISLELGNLTGAEGVPGGKDMPAPNVVPPVVPGFGVYDWKPITMGAYIANVDFTSTAYNRVTWAAGSIQFADGRSQITAAGSLTLTATHYIYCIWGNTTLQNSTSASDATGTDRVLVAVVSKASTTAQKAYALNPHTDSILINTDKVMDGLVTRLKIADEAVNNSKIADISAVKINAGDIAAARMSAGVLQALKVDVSTLDAISVNVGTLTGGTINGVTIYAGNGAVKLDSNGILIKGDYLRLRDSNNVLRGTIRGVLAGGLELYAFGSGSLWIGTVGGSIILNPGSLIVYPDSTSVSLGNSVKYWSYIYVNHLRFKDWSLFQRHDDVKLLRQIKSKVGSEEVDIDTVPEEIKEEGFINLGAATGLLTGAIIQLADRVGELEKKINKEG